MRNCKHVLPQGYGVTTRFLGVAPIAVLMAMLLIGNHAVSQSDTSLANMSSRAHAGAKPDSTIVSIADSPTKDLHEKAVVGQALGPFEFKGSLRSLPKTDPKAKLKYQIPRPGLPPGLIPGSPLGGPRDPLLPPGPSAASTAPFIPPPIVSFDGIPGGNPPDTNGVVGPNHYIQTINVSFEILDKTGTLLSGPTDFRTLFGANPATNTTCDNGAVSDPVVLYDPLADRFILTILAGTSFKPQVGPFFECIAVSKTNDPVNGGWFKYALLTDNTSLSDFPKLGVWPDAYYFSANMFPTSGSAFPRVWALDRNSILVGGLLHTQTFDVSSSFFSLLPENLHGTPPPVGESNVFSSIDFNNNNIVNLWNFHVDWVTPSNSTFGDSSHNPSNIVTVASYTHLSPPTCCIPQPNTTVVFLDALPDRLNYPAQFRNVAGTESLWLNHPVDTGGNVSGIRWYEIRDPSGSPTLFQQGTFNNQDDGVDRWMGSIGADQFGDMLVSYNVSNSTSVNPGMRYAGRLASDPLGALDLAEGTLINGGNDIINCTPDASKGQTTCTGRWGDYSGMSVDPVDDCTFWFTGEYVDASGSNRTRIGAVALPGCNADVSVTKSAPATVNAGSDLSYAITVANNGPLTAQFVTLADSTPASTTFVGLAQTGGPTFTCTTPPVGGTGAVNCTIPALPSGGVATFTLVVLVNSNAQNTIVQTATVSAYEQDPNPSNNTATVTTVVTQSADLSVSKVCKPDSSALAGTTAFCDITVTNNGPSDAQFVTLLDNIVASGPFSVTNVTASTGACSPTTTPPQTSTTIGCGLNTLTAGSTATVTVSFTATDATDVNDTATVSSTTPDPNSANNSATGHVSFVAAADLSVTKTASPNPVIAGTNLTYTITVTNSGPSVAPGVVMKDIIPSQVSVLTVTPSIGSCTAGIPGNPLQPLTCTLGSMGNGTSATITVVTLVSSSVPDSTVINNNATVSSSVVDPNTANNSATAAATVHASADLAITKTSDKGIYKPSSIITYTVTVNNNGPSDALAVIVTDNLPTTMQALYQSDTGGCTKSGLTLTCNLGNMPLGTTKSFIIRELVKGTRGLVSNTAIVTSSTSDPNLSNNSSTRVVTIGH